MEYEWYADLFFLEEAYRDVLILWLAAVLGRKKISVFRLLAAGIAGSHENPAQIVRREPCEEFMKQIRTYGTCADGEQAVEKFVVFHIVGN